MSAEQLITEHIDLWTSTIKVKNTQGRGSSKKRELYGIKKLRELILELAVRGKLVEQDDNDEPANELLKRIAAEKAKLIKDKKIRKQKPPPIITDEEKPFELPKGWEWTRLGNLGVGSTGKTPSTKEPSNFSGKIPFIGPGQITPSGELLHPEKFLSEEAMKNSTEARPGDVLMVCIGGSIGKSAICDKRIAFNQQINAIHPIIITSSFLQTAISTERFYQSVLDKSTGSATPIINRSKWEELLTPLCPDREQQRIVAKVDELMALCDQLEQQTESSLDAHNLLVDTLLATLTDARDARDLSNNWARLADHFDTLITTDYAVEQLKQTILQLAVMGKLVPQDPNDEPASELLERIAAEKEQLIKNKKVKKQKPLPAISEKEKPFNLPDGWACCRFIDLIPQFQNGASSRGDTEGQDIVVLRLADIKNWQVSMADTRSICIEQKSIDRYMLKEGDVLIIRVNGSADIVGRFITCTEAYSAIYCDHFIRMRFPITCFSSGYLSLLGSSRLIRNRIADLFVSTAGQKTVNQSHINSLIVTLPPLDEQQRIVAKADELIALCNTLKTNLNTAQTSLLQLADAMVEQAVA